MAVIGNARLAALGHLHDKELIVDSLGSQKSVRLTDEERSVAKQQMKKSFESEYLADDARYRTPFQRPVIAAHDFCGGLRTVDRDDVGFRDEAKTASGNRELPLRVASCAPRLLIPVVADSLVMQNLGWRRLRGRCVGQFTAHVLPPWPSVGGSIEREEYGANAMVISIGQLMGLPLAR